MFTGIVVELGTVRSVRRSGRSLHLAVAAPGLAPGLRTGDSVAVSGVCLTVVAQSADSFTADVMPETWDRTALGRLQPGDAVNLEPSLAAGDRLGGHIVQGHVDGVGRIARIEPQEIAQLVTISAPPEVLHYVVPKGSIAVDGISLTVIDVLGGGFTVGIIPHTWALTTMGRRREGDTVNLETDILGKYVEKFVQARLEGAAGGGVDAALLRRSGFIPAE